MWQVKRFVEILNEEGAEKAIKSTTHHISFLAHEFKKLILIRVSCDIRQELSKSVTLPHPIGIVIGRKAEIGGGVKIYQNVTIGSEIESGDQPTIQDGVIIGSGAVILGDVCIGENSVVGANSVVKDDIPPDCTAAGVPAEIVNKDS